MKKGNDRLVVEINSDLIKQLKIKAIQDDVTVTNIVEKLVIQFLNKSKERTQAA